MLSGKGKETGALNDGFLKYIENTFLVIHKVLLALQKCILSGAIKFVSVRPFQGNLSLLIFEITRNSELFSRKFQLQFNSQKEIIFQIPSFITFLNPKILGFFFIYERQPDPGSEIIKKLNFRKSQGIYQHDQMSFENCT